jgi:enamine deaminase RidA (YjgF/YER057c/UK114 family)
MSAIVRIATNAPWEPIVGYSRAVRAGDWVLVSGTTATGEQGGLVGTGQMYVQTKQAIANLTAALGRLGLGAHDVVRTRIFVTDITRWEAVARAHREAFGESRPATTMVEVRRLIHPDMLIEIEADVYAGAPKESAPPAPAAKPPAVEAPRPVAPPKPAALPKPVAKPVAPPPPAAIKPAPAKAAPPKAQPKPQSKAQPKPQSKAQPKPKAKAPTKPSKAPARKPPKKRR